MPEKEHSPPPRLSLRMPAAVVRVWFEGSERKGHEFHQVLDRHFLESSGIFRIDPGIFAVAPEAGDPAPFDTAVFLCRRISELLQDQRIIIIVPEGVRTLIAPGEVTIDDEQAELIPDPFSLDIDQVPPSFAVGAVHITGWAAHQLERAADVAQQPPYQGPSGRAFPIVKVGNNAVDPSPWRNPELLGRRLKSVDRPELKSDLLDGLADPAIRLEGPVGCGKSRLVWETLRQEIKPFFWTRAQPLRRRDQSPAQQIAQQLLDPDPYIQDQEYRAYLLSELENLYGREAPPDSQQLAAWALAVFERIASDIRQPIYLVCDDVEQIDPADSSFLVHLIGASEIGTNFRLIMLGRSGVELPNGLDSVTSLQVGPLVDREMGEYASRLFAGLSLPVPVQDRLIETTQGFPFALEEGMIALIREKSMRRIYGSFFFSGDEEAEYRPSLRLICHLQAEAGRLGGPTPFYLLSLLEMGAPAAPLGAAASSLTSWTPGDWEAKGLASGLLTRRESPWGPGIAISRPAFAQALSYAVPPDSLPSVRRVLGEILTEPSESGEAHWENYHLLRGTPEAVDCLLKVTETSFGAQIPREELLEALTEEMRLHRERNGDPENELQLLWRILPIARRLGKVQGYADDLARGLDLATDQPSRLLAIAGTKAELDQEAGRFREAEATMQRALKIARGTDLRRQALLLVQLGRLFMREQRFGEAGELFTNLGKALKQQGSFALAATCEYFLGNIAFHEKRLDDASRHHQVALEKRRKQNLMRPIGNSLSALGAVSLAMGNYPQALDFYRESHDILVRHGKETDVSYALMGLGNAYSRLGDHAMASHPIREAFRIREGKDDVAGDAIARLAMAENYLHLGQPAPALEYARKAHFQLSLVSLEHHLANAEQLLGRIFLSQRQPDEAEAHLRTALDKHREQGNHLAAGFDRAWMLEKALAGEDVEAIRIQTTGLRELVAKLNQADKGEQLHYRLFLGLNWLNSRGHKVGDPLRYLERAYEELLRKAAHLQPEQRHQYLFQNAENAAIVNAATEHGITEG